MVGRLSRVNGDRRPCRSLAVVDGAEAEGRPRVVLVAPPVQTARLVAVPGDIAVIEVGRDAVRPLLAVGGPQPLIDDVAAGGTVHAALRYNARHLCVLAVS